jgi:trimeric autotransporter adhesin
MVISTKLVRVFKDCYTSFNGFDFQAIGCGMNWNCDTPVNVFNGSFGSVNDFIEFNGELFITGTFVFSNNQVLNSIAKWNGVEWEGFGSGLKYNNNSIGRGNSLKVIDNSLYVVGGFDSCAGLACNSAAKFDGVNWSAVNNLPRFNPNSNNFLSDIEKFNGDLYVTGNFYDPSDLNGDLWRIARFDGQNWVPVRNGVKGTFGGVGRMLVANNLLYLGGNFTLSQNPTNPGNAIAAFDGVNWIDLGGGIESTGLPHVWDMKFHNNKLYVCGNFTKAGGVNADKVAYWDGINWFSLDTSGTSFDNTVTSLAFFKDTLYVGGAFWRVNGDSISKVAKWMAGDYYEAYGNLTSTNQHPKKEFELTIFPNPTTQSVTIKTNITQSASVIIYNVMGKEVYRQQITAKETNVDVSHFSNGVYFVRVNDEVKKLIKGE